MRPDGTASAEAVTRLTASVPASAYHRRNWTIGSASTSSLRRPATACGLAQGRVQQGMTPLVSGLQFFWGGGGGGLPPPPPLLGGGGGGAGTARNHSPLPPEIWGCCEPWAPSLVI